MRAFHVQLLDSTRCDLVPAEDSSPRRSPIFSAFAATWSAVRPVKIVRPSPPRALPCHPAQGQRPSSKKNQWVSPGSDLKFCSRSGNRRMLKSPSSIR
jgi:hypothetical protein